MDYCHIQRESKTLIRLTLQKPEISAGSTGHLACKVFVNYIVEVSVLGLGNGQIMDSVLTCVTK